MENSFQSTDCDFPQMLHAGNKVKAEENHIMHLFTFHLTRNDDMIKTEQEVFVALCVQHLCFVIVIMMRYQLIGFCGGCSQSALECGGS